MKIQKILLTSSFYFLLIPVFGQIDSTLSRFLSINDSTQLLYFEEKMPVFLAGGYDGMMKVLSDNIVYPPRALENNVGGRVVVKFTIDTTGFIKDLHVIKGVREDIDNEALRVVSLLKEWKPGMQNNKNVQVVYSLPICFWPNNKFKKKYLKQEKMNKISNK